MANCAAGKPMSRSLNKGWDYVNEGSEFLWSAARRRRSLSVVLDLWKNITLGYAYTDIAGYAPLESCAAVDALGGARYGAEERRYALGGGPEPRELALGYEDPDEEALNSPSYGGSVHE